VRAHLLAQPVEDASQELVHELARVLLLRRRVLGHDGDERVDVVEEDDRGRVRQRGDEAVLQPLRDLRPQGRARERVEVSVACALSVLMVQVLHFTEAAGELAAVCLSKHL
jgi:hypothetical protein